MSAIAAGLIVDDYLGGKTRLRTFSVSIDEFESRNANDVFAPKPSTRNIREFQARQSRLGFTYPAVGATATVPPAGYTVDHTRIKLGTGETVFTRAKAALAALGPHPPGLDGGVAVGARRSSPAWSWPRWPDHGPVVAERQPDRVCRR